MSNHGHFLATAKKSLEAMDNLLESSEGFESSQEVVPETQIAGEAQPYLVESSQGGILGFEEHMAHLEYGARRRFRISALTLHVNSSATGTQQAVGRAMRVESERGRRVGLRSSSSLGQNTLSQSNFSRREDLGPPIGGVADAQNNSTTH